jgi:hypothetical protein
MTYAVGYHPNLDDWDADSVSFFDTEEEARHAYDEIKAVIQHTERGRWWIELYICGEDTDAVTLQEERGDGGYPMTNTVRDDQMRLFV